MRRFLFGLACGLTIGTVGTATAAHLVGDNGYLVGWTVTKEGDEICDMPFVWTATKEIDCD